MLSESSKISNKKKIRAERKIIVTLASMKESAVSNLTFWFWHDKVLKNIQRDRNWLTT